RRRHPRFSRDWSSDVCSSALVVLFGEGLGHAGRLAAPTSACRSATLRLCVPSRIPPDAGPVPREGCMSLCTWIIFVFFAGLIAQIGRASCRERGRAPEDPRGL